MQHAQIEALLQNGRAGGYGRLVLEVARNSSGVFKDTERCFIPAKFTPRIYLHLPIGVLSTRVLTAEWNKNQQTNLVRDH